MWGRVSDPFRPGKARLVLCPRKPCRAALDLDGSETRPHTISPYTGVAVFRSGLKNGIFTIFAVTC